MRIAILADALDLQYAGVSMYLRGLLSALLSIDDGHEYLLVRPKAGGEFVRARELVVPILPGIPGHQYWRALTAIPKILTRENVDVVVEPAHFGPFSLPGHIKRVTIIHDLTPVLFPRFHSLSSSIVHRMVLPGIFLKADHILTNSVYTKQDIEKHYPAAMGKISVVHPGADAIFRPAHDQTVLRKYGIRQPYLLYVGTIEPRKNLLEMLRAFEALRETGAAIQWVIVGKKGWKNDAFFAALESSSYRSDIVMTGYVERGELPVLYSMARLFVYPSLYEGFGLPVLEAMSCGVPVLSSGTSSLPEVGGPAARYAETPDAAGFFKEMASLVSDDVLLAQMGNRSLEQAARFRWAEGAKAFRGALGLK